MKKFFAMLFLLFAFILPTVAQDGATRLNYYNHTSQWIRMLVNGNPACTGDVMPGGWCTEAVNPGTYLMQGTNGRETTSGFSCTVQYGEHCDYTVNENTSELLNNPRVTTVDLKSYTYFAVDTPAPLKTLQNGDVAKTTNGTNYNKYMWGYTADNGDAYMVGMGEYPFSPAYNDLDNMISGFVTATNGTLVDGKVTPLTVSGQPAKGAIISAKLDNGKEIRFIMVVTFKGNCGYMFVFGSYIDSTTTDIDAVKTFFTSIQLK